MANNPVAYRYGFNGQEKENALYGEGKAYDFGARMYDSRTGRFFKTDNYFKQFPSESNYSFAGNNPIFYIDEGGNKKTTYYTVILENGYKMKFNVVDNTSFKYKTVHNNYDFGSDGYYKGYDYSVNVTIDLTNGSKKTTSEPKIDKSHSRNFTFTEKIKMQLTPSDAQEVQMGGIMLYSTDGKGEETRIAIAPDGQMVKIDELVNAANAFNELSMKGMYKNNQGKGLVKMFKDLVEAFADGQAQGKRIVTLYEAAAKLYDETILPTRKDSCKYCGEKGFHKDLMNGTHPKDSIVPAYNKILE